MACRIEERPAVLSDAEGRARCEVCGAISIGIGYQYPVLWDLGDVVDDVGAGRPGLRGKVTRAARRLRLRAFVRKTGSGRTRIPRIAQGIHESFSHRDTLAHAIDVALPYGTALLAGRDGEVVEAQDGFSKGKALEELRMKANCVVIRHDDGTYGRYFHLAHDSVPVKVGDHVQVGDIIGRAGSTGFSRGTHLHFDVMDCYVKETSTLDILLDQGLGCGNDAQQRVERIESSFATFSALQEVSAPLVMAHPAEIGIEQSVLNSKESENCILLCDRGGSSSFYEKALAAQKAGASALLIADNDTSLRGMLHLLGGKKAHQEEIKISVLGISHESGAKLKRLSVESKKLVLRIGISPHFNLKLANPMENMPHCKPVSQPFIFGDGVFL